MDASTEPAGPVAPTSAPAPPRSGSRGTQGPRAAQTRQRIIDSALRVFLRDGYATAKVDDIVALVPATRATFYLYFASKGEVMHALLEDMLGASAMVVNPPVNREISYASVRAWFDEVVEYWRAHRSLLLVLDGAAAADREIAALADGSTRASIALLAGWIRDADTDPDPQLTAMLLHSEATAFLHRVVVKGWQADVPGGLDRLAERWYAALRRD